MNMNDYQIKALSTAVDEGFELEHRYLGIAGEAGEIAEIFKKWYRDDKADKNKLDKQRLASELGDLLWYVATLADCLGYELEQIATANVAKLADRQERDKLRGSGDHR
jgi:NTP pyrophosphatase (non-canonical NTP hydrolase)